MFGPVKLTRNAIERKFVYDSWGIAFDEAGSWSFGNDFDRNDVVFGSLSHTDNQKNNFWALGEGPTGDINDSVGTAEKQNSINFTKANKKYSLNLHYSGD